MEERNQLTRSDSTLAASGLKDVQRRQEVALQLCKCIPSLLHYLELERDERVHFCLAKSGKRKEWEGWLSGKPALGPNKVMHTSRLPRGLESIAVIPSLKAAQKRANTIRAEWEEALKLKRLEALHVSNDAADGHLHAVFEAHHDRLLAHEQGLTRMSVCGFLCVLRECTLLDNATAPTDADRIFTQEALQQPQPPCKALSEGEGQVLYVDYAGFVACLVALAKQRRDVAQPQQPWEVMLKKSRERRRSATKMREQERAQKAQQVAHAQQQAEKGGAAGPDGRGLKFSASGLSMVIDNELDGSRELRREPSGSAGSKERARLPVRRTSSFIATSQSLKKRLSGPAPEVLYQALLRHYILPLANTENDEQDPIYDALFAPTSLAVLHKFDHQLRALFSWYSTLDDPRSLSWDKIVDFKITLGADQFVLMLINFKVVPLLMSRQDAFHCCDDCFSPEGISCLFRDMSYSGFLLCLAACAAFLPGTLVPRIQKSCTPEELHHYKRYLMHAQPELQTLLGDTLQEMESQRRAKLDDQGRQAAGKSFYEFQGERYQAATAQFITETDLENKLVVLNRREEARQALALTRLRNFYADVRSAAVFQNLRNSSKGPSKASRSNSPGLKARKSASAGADGVWGEVGLGLVDEAPKTPISAVAFFSDSMQIKTPKLPANLSATPSSYLSHPNFQPPWAHATSPRQSSQQQLQDPHASTQPLHTRLQPLECQPAPSIGPADRPSGRDHSWLLNSPKPPPVLNSLKSMASNMKGSHSPSASMQRVDSPLCWVPSKKAQLVEQELQLLVDAANNTSVNGSSRLGHAGLVMPVRSREQQLQPLSHPQQGSLQSSINTQHHHQHHHRAHAHHHHAHAHHQQHHHQQYHSHCQPTQHALQHQHEQQQFYYYQQQQQLLHQPRPHVDRLCIEARDESEVMRAFTATLPSIASKKQEARRAFCGQSCPGAAPSRVVARQLQQQQ